MAFLLFCLGCPCRFLIFSELLLSGFLVAAEDVFLVPGDPFRDISSLQVFRRLSAPTGAGWTSCLRKLTAADLRRFRLCLVFEDAPFLFLLFGYGARTTF